MGISQLPKINIPDEETLNDEEKHILEAFKIIHDGYQCSQRRLRAVSKAYAQLESITLNLLNERNEHNQTTEPSPKKRELPPSDRNVRKRLSPLQLHNDTRDDSLDVMMVDLTCDFPTSEQTVNVATSPVFGHQKKRGRNNSGLEKTESAKNLKQQFKEVDVRSSTSKLETSSTANQECNVQDFEAAENNEENRPPLTTFNDTTLYLNESQAVAKIGFSKTVYNVEAHRTSTGKRSKQSTLVFKPQTSRIDLSVSEHTFARPNVCQKLGDLFDEDYCNTKKPAAKIGREKEQESRNVTVKDLVEEKLEQTFSSKTDAAATSKAILKLDKDQKPEETPTRRKEVPLAIETPSQIDDTARSLFDDDDDDLDVFNGSEDLLNTCMDSPTVVDNAIQPSTPDIKEDKGVGAITSTSKVSQSSHFSDSINETFFAPVETKTLERITGQMEKDNPKPGCSTTAEAKDSHNTNRNLKRKSKDETALEAIKELGDFGVQDIDWDQDISNDNWPPPKRTLNNSFDIIPEKKKKSPNYAYKGKVERNQAERAKLRGWDCKDCENYYGNMNLPEEERKKQMDRCSRHRSKYNQRYLTPHGFWDPMFSDSSDNSDDN